MAPAAVSARASGLQATANARSARSLRTASRPAVRRSPQLCCRAGLGIGFTDLNEEGEPSLLQPQPARGELSPEYGLTARQMAALGVDAEAGFSTLPAPEASALTAKSFYVGDFVTDTARVATKMSAGAPGQAPPDLPSLLLDGRICYIGMPLVASVTELIISELLWLNYNNPEKPVYLYINSTGSQTQMNEAVGFDTEAYAILDTMNYIRPEIHTLAVGSAFGNAAMLLASGKKGCRFSLPHARIQTCPPRMNRAGGNASNVMIKANELEYCTQTYTELLAKFTGQEEETVRKDIGRNRYFTPEEAVEYGLVDRIVRPSDDVAMEARNYEAMLAQAQAQQRGGGYQPAGAGA